MSRLIPDVLVYHGLHTASVLVGLSLNDNLCGLSSAVRESNVRPSMGDTACPTVGDGIGEGGGVVVYCG